MHVHFVFLLVLLLLGAGVHAAQSSERSMRRSAELFLLYLLVGYCGVPMLAVSIWVLTSPVRAAAGFGFTAEGPLLAFFGWAYLGMSLLAILSLVYRRTYLVAPVVVWAVYLGGATLVHLQESGGRGLEIFASHGLVAVLLLAALAASGAWKQPQKA